MDNYHVIFSLDKIKFLNIVSSDIYEEKLGNVMNYEWHLKVSKVRDEYSDNPFDFQLYVVNISDLVKVKATIVEPSQYLVEKTFEFKNGALCFNLGQYNYVNLIIDQFYIVFKFYKSDQMGKINSMTSNSVVRETDVVSKEKEINRFLDLSSDFEALLKEEHLTDVTITCSSSKFHVHKLILLARSAVFRAMFSSPMQENATNTIAIDDLEPEVVQPLIQFLYSGKVTVKSVAMASDLLYAAEKYQLTGLKDGIWEYLKSELNVGNAVQVLRISDLHAESFKEDVIKYIAGHFKEIKTTNDWKDLTSEKPVLALEVYSEVA